MDHFVQRRCNQAAQADDIDGLFARHPQYLIAVHHDAQVDDFEIIALQHDPHDILANIVHVAFYRRHEDFAVGVVAAGLFLFDKRLQIRHGLFHHTGALDHLREEHLALTEQVAHHVHTIHQRALDDLDGARKTVPRLFGVLDHEGVDSFYQRVFQPLGDILLAPAQILHPGFARAA